jgi:hypothetical protein
MIKDAVLNIEVDSLEMTEQHKRLIKSINSLLTHVITTDDESEYFESSSELMRLVATAIKKSNFAAEYGENADIPYGNQALEFCVDRLSDQVYEDDVVKYDN